jgi:SNF2 family DNA or RNA helicase
VKGTVTLAKGKFVVDCEPHVVLRLKRVFGGISRKSHGKIRISAAPETAYDLRWFLQRYPMEACAELELLAGQHAETLSLVDELLSCRRTPPDFDLAIPLREYQRIATAITLQAKSLLLADDVGIGKTASAIGLFTDPRTLPALVVTLTHLPTQWEREINRFAPKLKTHVLRSGQPYDVTRPFRMSKKRWAEKQQLALYKEPFPDVVITNYHKLRGWTETLAPIIRSVVFDECQELRRSESQKYSAAKHVAEAAEFRMGLSATPIYNYGSEIWCVLNCIKPGGLGTWGEFLNEWCSSYHERHPIQNPKAFGTYVREAGLMLRRTRADVGRELPALTKVPHHVEADTAALDNVATAATELARVILRQGEQQRGEKMQASEELSVRLRQATGIAKAPYVAAFVRLLVESGEKVLLYGWHREVYRLWQEALLDLGPVMYTGTESPQQKEAAKQAFVEDGARVLMMSLRSGAGLDGLQSACRTVVFGELDWSPGVHEQCAGRIHRDGQPDPVMAYYLYADHGSDPIVLDVLGVKRQQAQGVVNPDAALVERLQASEGNMRRLAEAYLEQQGLRKKETAA